MAYDKRRLLVKIIEIQDIVLRERKRGVSQVYIYKTFIKDPYFISKRTFDNYLSRNAKKELNELDNLNKMKEIALKARQIQILEE